MKDAFDDADAALRLLTDRLRSWPSLKRNDYKQLAELTGFATNYVMQLRHFENGVTFNPRNVVNDLYGKFNPQMMGDYQREWAQEELLKGMVRQGPGGLAFGMAKGEAKGGESLL